VTAADPRPDVARSAPAVIPPVVRQLIEQADYVVAFAVRVAADLGLADLLTSGERDVAQLAADTGTHPGALYRLLRALAAQGIFAEVTPGVFGLTPLAEPLRSDHPLSLRETYTMLPSDTRAWGRLAETIRTGRPGFDLAHGTDYWSYLAAHPAEGRRVDRWMRSVNRLHLRTAAAAFPWREVRTLVDVGGGDGSFAAGLLARHPGLRATVVDLPHVVAAAPGVLADAGVADRAAVVPGSFFDPLPAGADAYVLKTVLPGFTDADVHRILRRLHAAMRPDSRLVILEAILPPGDAFDVAKLFDVHTMVLTGGAHRTREQTRRLLGDAGLALRRVQPTATLTLIEAVRDDAPS
jgi:hypothetical protein